MKKLLLLAGVCLLGCVACEKENAPEPVADPAFKNVNHSEMSFTEEGGTFTCTFEIENPVKDAVVETVVSVDWVTISAKDEGSITFVVAANESYAARETSVTVSYTEKANFNVSISQEGAGISRTGEKLSAKYYGTEYSDVESDNFYTHISDKGFVDGEAQPDAWYYRIDLYSEAQDYSREDPSEVIIPNGTYTFDPDSTTEPWTFSAEYSGYFTVDQNGQASSKVAFESGQVVVSDNLIVVDVIINGEPHHVVYEGSLQCEDSRTPLTLSTLTGDYKLDYSNHDLYLDYYGDYFECGYDNYVLNVIPKDGTGDYFKCDMTTNGTAMGEGLEGTYEVNLNPNLDGAFQYVYGYLHQGMLAGTWFFNSPDGMYYGDTAPIVDGGFEIIDNGDGTITVKFNLLDDLENAITGTWTGTAIIESSQAPARMGADGLSFKACDYAKR